MGTMEKVQNRDNPSNDAFLRTGHFCGRREFLTAAVTSSLYGAAMFSGCGGLPVPAQACMQDHAKDGMDRRDDLLAGPKEKAIVAVKSGDTQKAIRYIEKLHLSFKPTHDRFNDWHQSLLNFIADKLGEEAVGEALDRVFEDVYRHAFEPVKNLDHDVIVAYIANAWRAHYSDFHIEEDEEKTVFVITYCGSGGRLQKMRAPFGRRTKKSYPWSFNRAGVNYYCGHEAVYNEKFKEMGLGFVQFQYGEQFDPNGVKTGCNCKVVIYKDKKKFA